MVKATRMSRASHLRESEGHTVNPDLRTWRQSYKHLPFGAGEEEVNQASTSDLQAAHRLMEPCREKPPRGSEFQLSREKISSLFSEDTWVSYFRNLFLDENLRYARVCKELARRVEPGNPELALHLLMSALLPGSSSLAFESHDEYMSFWDGTSQTANQLGTELMQLAAELQGLSEEAGEYNRGYTDDVLLRCLTGWVHFSVYDGLLTAAFAISQRQDAWNFRVKASMVAPEERLGHREEAAKLKEQCLDILRVDDDLWSDVLDKAMDTSLISPPATLLPASPMAEDLETALSRVLDSKFEPLLASMGDNLRITHALHDRLDLIVEKLIDLNQRSELTWQQVRKLVRQEPDYEEVRRGIEVSLASLLRETWPQLKPDSRKDLVDAEYVFQQCARWGTGWRMAVLGYCTTAERELKASYKAARGDLLSVPDTEPGTIETLGDLIQAVEKLGAWLPKSKPAPPALTALLNSTDVLKRLNKIRVRAAHPADREVSRDEAVWARDALLSGRSGPLLVTIIAAGLKQ